MEKTEYKKVRNELDKFFKDIEKYKVDTSPLTNDSLHISKTVNMYLEKGRYYDAFDMVRTSINNTKKFTPEITNATYKTLLCSGCLFHAFAFLLIGAKGFDPNSLRQSVVINTGKRFVYMMNSYIKSNNADEIIDFLKEVSGNSNYKLDLTEDEFKIETLSTIAFLEENGFTSIPESNIW